jgi:DNA-binding LacI/PurR family transcriptional regulator
MAVTIKDIAQHLGLSHQAVSFAMRGVPKVGPATRERVLAAARELGYRPNSVARSMRAKRFGSIGLLLSDDLRHSNLPPQLLRGIQETLEKQDVQLTVGRLPDEILTRSGYVPALLRHWSADGLLINYQEGIPQRMIELINEEHVPAMWINSRQASNCVYADDFAAAREATARLIALGHRRIAFVDYSHGDASLASGSHYSALDRQGGYEHAMTDAGLAPRVLRPPGLFYTTAERPVHARALLEASDRPTAIVCYSGSTLAPVALAALMLGLKIPQDLSLIDFGDAPMTAMGFIPTTMIVPQEALGRQAVQSLLGRLETPDAPVPQQAIAYTYEPGASVAPPNKNASNQVAL